MVFINTNTYILTEDRNFKVFLKANYAIALGSCDMLIKKMMNMELNKLLTVLMEFAKIRQF